MTQINPISLNASDVLAAIAFEAQKIVAAAGHHAAGAPFPDPQLLAKVIARMGELNQSLMQLAQINQPAANDQAA